jgi:hypothetical protein
MGMDPPNKQYPSFVTNTPSMMPMYLQDPSIKGKSFDQLLTNRGIRLIHRKAVPCPNMLVLDNSNHDPDCDFCDNSGIIYYGDKEIWGVFTGNSIEKTFEAHGVWEAGTAVITLPTEYPDGEQADFNTYDRLIIPDFTVRLYEMKEYEPRPGNLQELRYPASKVEFASSIQSGVQKIYQQGVDFQITANGDIEWLPGKEPAYDNVNERGVPIVWSYFANPQYIVIQSLRELRITQELVNNQKVAKRLPQEVLVKRDFFVSENEKIVTK